MNDDARPGRPSTSTTNENTKAGKKIVMENRQITIRKVAEDVGISVGSCHATFPDILGLRRVAAKFVPKLLNFDQKTRRMTIAQGMFNDVNDDPDLLKKVITGNESWLYGYDVETKAQSSQWKHTESTRPKKARQVRSNVKVLLTVFFDYHGVVHKDLKITLKLCAVCVKQYERNACNCGKTIHSFCITITHPLTRHCFFVIFWPKTTP